MSEKRPPGAPARPDYSPLDPCGLFRGFCNWLALKQIGFVFKISAASRGRWFYGKDHASNPSDNNLNAKTLVSGTSTMAFVSLLTFSCLRPSSLFRRQHFYGIDHALCFSANVVVSSTIGKAFPTIGKIDCRRIVLLFNKIAIVFDHGRQGFADWFCLSANSFVSPPMFLALRLTAGRLRECFWRFPQRYCDFADSFGSPPMVL